MKRITPETKAIADAHIAAKQSGSFDDPEINSVEELIEKLRQGKTFSAVLRKIEARYISITSIMMSEVLSHTSETYKKGVYKGFKILLQP